MAGDGPLGAGEAISIGLDLCRALAAIHAAGLVHGDVKAANVLRERGGRIVLGDLGSATEAGATPITGSPATLAPEVLAGGPATPGADLYSLGVLLFQLLSGRFPVDAANPEAGRTTLRDLRPDLPPALIEVVERAADPDPARRFPSAGALEQALSGASHQPARVSESAAAAKHGEATKPGAMASHEARCLGGCRRGDRGGRVRDMADEAGDGACAVRSSPIRGRAADRRPGRRKRLARR